MKYSLNCRLAPLFIVLASYCTAQVSSLAAAVPLAAIAGPPKNPTISAVTPLWQGVLLQEHIEELSGPVTEARREYVIADGAALNPTRGTTVLRFDSDGHLIERMDQDSSGTITTTSVSQNGKIQSQTRTRHHADGRFPDWQEWWRKWSYDTNGRVSEFRAGSNNKENNHFLNFKYDAEGRLLGFEYRQGGSDKPFSFTEFKYEDKTITADQFDENHRKIFEQLQVLDGSRHVIELSISDMNNGALKLWYHTKFKYDEQGRLIEQNTDQYNYAPGDVDSEPPPGKIAIQYDDRKHSGEQGFYDLDGKLLLRVIAEFDAHGYVTKTEAFDATGKQPQGSEETWRDPKTHKTHSGKYVSDAIYDDHGNWTELRSWFVPADGGDRILTRSSKQTITYH
jgi:hypothetical protein